MHTIFIAFAGLVFGASRACSQAPLNTEPTQSTPNPAFTEISVQSMIIALPKEQALRFIAQHHLNAEADAGLKDLQALVAEKQAINAASPALTAPSGDHAACEVAVNTPVPVNLASNFRAAHEVAAVKLEVEAEGSPEDPIIDANLSLGYGLGIKLGTLVHARNGKVKFLGAFDAVEADKNVTYLAFVRLTVVR